jgi:hypothetical protein
MGLFGTREEKRAKETAAQAQSERLAALPVADLAAEIMPAFSPAIEALQVLENAGLLSSRDFGGSGSSASTYEATRAGEEALADGSVRQRLGA